MEQLLEYLVDIISSKGYGTTTTITIVVLIVVLIYNKIKFQCFEKVSAFVAEVEAQTDLTGEQKFELCKIWLANEMKITNKTFMNTVVEKLINLAYNNSHTYALRYISRKTNVEPNKVHNALNMVKEIEENKEKEKENSYE